MPCNARVVQMAKIAGEIPTIEKLRDIFKNHQGAVEAIEGGYRIHIGVVVADINIKAKTIILKSYAADWDTGVKQLQALLKMIRETGIPLEDIGQPETHRHDEAAAPWQRVTN